MDLLANHAQANAVFEPVVEGRVAASHAYLLHGPAGSGRSEVAGLVATFLLAEGSARDDTAARVKARSHPDLTWISPAGANGEVLVDDIRERVVAAVPMTPFEAKRRVFVIEGADRMNESAANAFLKTLEEPPAFAHLILIADSLDSVMPTLVSRCQTVRFDPASIAELAARLEQEGFPQSIARECAELADGDGARARMLADDSEGTLRRGGEELARAALTGSSATARPWVELISSAAELGKAAGDDVRREAAERLETAARSERTRIERDGEERAKRAQRRAESAAVDLALFVAESWLRDLHRASLGAGDLIGMEGRRAELTDLSRGTPPVRIRSAIDMIGRTRRALRLNVTRELALEALAHRLDGALG